MNRIYLLFFLMVNTIFAQFSIQGHFKDEAKNIQNVVLYTFKNGKPKYISYTQVKDKSFTFDSTNFETGAYRILYHNGTNGFIDFIFNQEDIHFYVDSNIGLKSLEYKKSSENQLLQSYEYNLYYMQKKLDSVQISYLKKPTRKTLKKYEEIQTKINGAQHYFEQLGKNKYALNFIKSSKSFNAKTPFKDTEMYLNSLQNHYFDYVDFNNPKLFNATFLRNKVTDFVFLLQNSSDRQQQNILYQNAIELVFQKIKNDKVKENILESLLRESMVREELVSVSQLKKIYETLPENLKNNQLLKEVNNTSQVMLGAKAANFKISESLALHDIESQNILLIFWSSTCGHCTNELPKVYDFLKEKPNLKVVTIGIEYEKDLQQWKNQIKFFPEWNHTISLGKWKSKTAVAYNIYETPSYFILDQHKKIIAKPQSLELLKEAF